MRSLSSTLITHNHKLYFSKTELSKILNCYAVGVSNGNWKDYALNFNSNGSDISISSTLFLSKNDNWQDSFD